jgi:hypothetical protein
VSKLAAPQETSPRGAFVSYPLNELVNQPSTDKKEFPEREVARLDDNDGVVEVGISGDACRMGEVGRSGQLSA